MESWKKSSTEHWNNVGSAYDNVWYGAAKQLMSTQEKDYITSMVNRYMPKSVLDVGCGTGRILDIYIRQPSITAIYGLDIASSMVAHCNQRFQKEQKIKKIICADIQTEHPFPETTFDIISAIRVLKYNKDWKKMLQTIYGVLNENGIFICTIPNVYSITGLKPDTFSAHHLPIQYTTPKEFARTLEKIGFRIIDIQGFTKLPEVFYTHTTSPVLAKTVKNTETILQYILGSTFGSRILFATCKKV